MPAELPTFPHRRRRQIPSRGRQLLRRPDQRLQHRHQLMLKELLEIVRDIKETQGKQLERLLREQGTQGRLLGSLVEGFLSAPLEARLGDRAGTPVTLKDVRGVVSAVLACPEKVDVAAAFVVDHLLEKNRGWRAVLTAEVRAWAALLDRWAQRTQELDDATVKSASEAASALRLLELDKVPSGAELDNELVERALGALGVAEDAHQAAARAVKEAAATEDKVVADDGMENSATARSPARLLPLLRQYWHGDVPKRRELLCGGLCLPALTSLQPIPDASGSPPAGRSPAVGELKVDRMAPVQLWSECAELTLTEVRATSLGLGNAMAQLQRSATVLAHVYRVIREAGSSNGLQLPEKLQVHAFVVLGQDGDERANLERLPRSVSLLSACGSPVSMDLRYLVARGGALHDWEAIDGTDSGDG